MFEGPQAEELVRELFLLSAWDFLNEWFESDEVKVSFATNAVIGEMCGPKTPGTAYVLAHHNIGVLDGQRKVWGFAKGGMGRISEALAASARHHGVEIRTSVGVRRILLRDGRSIGVETSAGELVHAPVVASNLDVKRTLLELTPPEAVPVDIRRQVERFRTRGAALKFNAALDNLPEFTAAPGRPWPASQGRRGDRSLHGIPREGL